MKNNHINYIEFKAIDLNKIKIFYNRCFGWDFKDYWDEYIAFSQSWIEWWFVKSDKILNWVLVVLYNDDLENLKNKIITNWWIISKDIFSFPWWKRFQFKDPDWNELAVWSDK